LFADEECYMQASKQLGCTVSSGMY